MFRHFLPNKTMLKLIRLIIKAFFIYTTCLSDPVEKSSKITPLKGNLNPNPPWDVEEIKKAWQLCTKNTSLLRVGLNLWSFRLQNKHAPTELMRHT